MDPLALMLLGGVGYVAIASKPDEKAKAKNALVRSMVTGGFSPKTVRSQATQQIKLGVNTTQYDLEIAKKAKEAWDKASAEVKKATCEKLKKEFPTNEQIQSIDCTKSSYAELAKIVGAAAGAAACSATGAGATVAAACGWAGAKIGTYLQENADEWAEDAWNKTKDVAKDVYGSTVGKLF